jgi:protein-S-isoprenylcysteine O-methyltransferase Ste14
MNTKIPPPIVAIAFAILMWQLDSLLPMGHLSLPGFAILSSLLGVLGLVVMGLAIGRFREVGTTVDPRDPSLASALVSSGIFGRSRNPMYVGMLFLLTAWAIWLGNGANVVLIYLFFSFMTRFQIKPEEQALTKLFGQEYEDYCKKVNRWF